MRGHEKRAKLNVIALDFEYASHKKTRKFLLKELFKTALYRQETFKVQRANKFS